MSDEASGALEDADSEMKEAATKLSGDHNTKDDGRADQADADLQDAGERTEDEIDR